jgi:hypothetical protein
MNETIREINKKNSIVEADPSDSELRILDWILYQVCLACNNNNNNISGSLGFHASISITLINYFVFVTFELIHTLLSDGRKGWPSRAFR